MPYGSGPTLLQVAIRPGTRLLNSALPPDGKIVDYLQREFGREIIKKPPWKVLDQNKKLKLRELIALFRYHYWHTWEKDYKRDGDGLSNWPRRREFHARLLDDFKNLLIQYDFHGYGNPEDDNGIVVFAEDRLVLKEMVVAIPSADYSTLSGTDFRQFHNIGEVKEFFRRRGSHQAKELAKSIAAAYVSKPRVAPSE